MRKLGTAPLTIATAGVMGLATAPGLPQNVYIPWQADSTPHQSETIADASTLQRLVTVAGIVGSMEVNSNYAELAKIIPNADDELLSDAAPFYGHVRDLEWKPDVWSDAGEVAFEWIKGDKHAIVSFDGDGTYGYAMKVGDRFVPGVTESPYAHVFPDDLKAYVGGA